MNKYEAYCSGLEAAQYLQIPAASQIRDLVLRHIQSISQK